MVLCIELVVPFLIFAPRRLRFFAAACIAGLNLVIFLSGNYNFFNLLVAGLCLFLLDDAAVRRWLPARIMGLFRRLPTSERRLPLRNGILALVATLVLYLGIFQMVRTFSGSVPSPPATLMGWVSPFRIVNSYGLFANMTTSRPEIRVQGSNDGQTWSDYEFKYKPGDPGRMPRWAQPHQPRLDWQMWFVALGSYRHNPWFINLAERLLQGSPDVLRLLEHNPFPEKPPRFVRAELYEYRFTDFATNRADGTWWESEYLGLYLPPVSLGGN